MKCKGLLFFMGAFLIVNCSQAQSHIILARPLNSSSWSYFNIKGEIIISNIGPDAYPFSEDGFAVVGEDEYELINKRGEKIKTETTAEKVRLKDFHGRGAKGYSDGLIIVRERGKYGCLDTLGRIKIPFKYYDIVPFQDGYAMARIKTNFFVIDINGQETLVDDTTVVDMERFKDNLAPFRSRTDKMGFVDTHGKVVIPAQFDRVGYFSKGLAWARNDRDLIGFINYDGKWVIEPQFSAVHDFDPESGLAMCKAKTDNNSYQGTDEWKWVYVNTVGEKISFNNAEASADFSEGLAAKKERGQYGFINTKGEWAIKTQFDDVREFKDGLAWVKQQRLWGLIDKQGNWVLTPRFEAIKGIVKLKDYKG